MEKIKVYLFTDGNYTDIVLLTMDACLEWIRADCDNLAEDDERDYTIKIAYMTKNEIDALPEAD